MEIRVLRYFLAVAREESISGAAEYLHITQPTLSRQLMELEDELGAKLLIRGKRNRRVILTDEGMLLRRRAEEIVELADKTEAEFHARDEIVSGDVYIGGGETDAMHFVARAAKALQEQYPDIRYHLFSGNADDVDRTSGQGAVRLRHSDRYRKRGKIRLYHAALHRYLGRADAQGQPSRRAGNDTPKRPDRPAPPRFPVRRSCATSFPDGTGAISNV